MIRFAYLSHTAHDMTPAQLNDILTVAHQRNAADQITGMLVYYDKAFLQLLEGPEHKVQECFNRISRDPRHHNIHSMEKTSARTRAFSNWSMGLADINAMPSLPADTLRSLADISARLHAVSGIEIPAGKRYVADTLQRFLRRFDHLQGRSLV